MIRTGVLFCLASVLSLAACSDEEVRFPKRRKGDFAHAQDDTLRMNELQLLATHNSYHVRLTPSPIPDWDYFFSPLREQLEDQGVRGLELDIHFNETTNEYDVYHVSTVDAGTTCQRFDDCLAEIRRFSDRNPGHHPLFVQIELKDEGPEATLAAQLDLIDTQIRNVFPDELLVTPDMVRGSRATLREAVTTDGWPTLAASRGRTMFAFDCDREICLAYAHGDLEGRVVFVDSEPADDFAAVMIANTPNAYATSLVEQGFIVRVFADGAKDVLQGAGNDLDVALASGAQVVSTDFPIAREGIAYVAAIPDGTPSRCNPVSAPITCVTSAIEDPRLLR